MAPYWKAPASGTRRCRCCELLALSSRTPQLGDLAHTAALVSIGLQPGLGLLICGMGVLAGECQVWSPAQGSLELRLATGLSSEDVKREKDVLRHHCPAVHSDGDWDWRFSTALQFWVAAFCLDAKLLERSFILMAWSFSPIHLEAEGWLGDWGQADVQGLPGAWR